MASKSVIFDVLAVAKAEGFDAAEKKINSLSDTAERTNKNMHLLSTGILALGPAIVPVAAAGVAAIGGLTGAAGAAALAFKGLSDQWKAGTLQAQPVGKQITALKGNLKALESISATAISPGLTEGLQKINTLSPLLQQDIEGLSTQLGQVASHVGPALVILFHRLNPLFLDLGQQLVNGSASFEKWAGSSTSVSKFVSYAEQQLPIVEHALVNLAQTAGKLVEAIAPMGGGSLTAISLLTQTINRIPVGVLQVAVPLFAGLRIAGTVSAAFTNLAAAAGPLAVRLGLVATAEGAASTAAFGLSASFGPLATATVGVAVGLQLLKDRFPVLNKILTQQTVPAVDENTAGMDALRTSYRNTHNEVEGTAQQLIAWGKSAAGARSVTHDYAASQGQLNDALRQLQGTLPPTAAQIGRAAAQARIASGNVRALGGALDGVPRNVHVNMSSNAASAAPPVQHFKDLVDSISRNVTVYIQTSVSQRTAQALKFTRATGGRVKGGQKYLVNEIGQELFVRDNDGAFLIPGGPHMWTAPGNGQVINAATVRGLRTRIGSLASAALQQIPSAARSAVLSIGNILPYGSAITRVLQREDTVLTALVARRVALANRLKAANQQLAATQQAYGQEVGTVLGAVRGSFDLLNAGKDVYGNISAGGILSDLSTSVSNANLFARDLRLLKGRIPNSVLQQLAEAGPSALPTLNALVGASSGQLRQFSSLETMLGNVGTVAGRTTAGALYGAQIRSQENLVKALQAQEKATERLERRLQQTMVKSLNITIHGGDPKQIIQALDRYLHTDVARKLR